MTKNKFKESIRRGLGLAILELKNNENKEEYREIVLWACLHNTCYDMQSEGDRCYYLYQAILVFGETAYFEDKICEQFEKNEGWWLFEQLSGILFLLAKAGRKKAKAALIQKYEMLLYCISKGKNRVGILDSLCIHLVSLDGFRAFRKIVPRLIELEEFGVTWNDFMWFYENSIDKFGKEKIDSFLQMESDRTKKADFLKPDDIREVQVRQFPETLEELYTVIKQSDQVAQLAKRRKIVHYLKKAGLVEQITFAEKSIMEPDIEIKRLMLGAFSRLPFPLSEEYIANWIKDPEWNELAYEMLSQIKSPFARATALHLLKTKTRLVDGIIILCNNYKKEDEELLFQSVKLLSSGYNGELHHMGMCIVELFKKRKGEQRTRLIVYLYEKTLCSYCRYYFFKLMNRYHQVTEKDLEAAIYDSNEVIRKYAKRMLNRKEL